jgi:hypothetical protein
MTRVKALAGDLNAEGIFNAETRRGGVKRGERNFGLRVE